MALLTVVTGVLFYAWNLSLFERPTMLPRAMYDAVQQFPLWKTTASHHLFATSWDDPRHFDQLCQVGAVVLTSLYLLMAVALLRLLRLRPLLKALHSSEGVATREVFACVLGLFILLDSTFFVIVETVGQFSMWQARPWVESLTWLSNVSPCALGLVALYLLLKCRDRSVVRLAVCLHATLLLVWLSVRAMGVAWWVAGSMNFMVDFFGWTVALATPASWVWSALTVGAGGIGLALGGLMVSLAYRGGRPLPWRAALVVLVLVGVSLLPSIILGWLEYRAVVKTLSGTFKPIHAGMDQIRTAVILTGPGSGGPTSLEYNLAGTLDDLDMEVARGVLSGHPSMTEALAARRFLTLAHLMRWEEKPAWEHLLAHTELDTRSAAVLYRLQKAFPHVNHLPYLQRLASPEHFVMTRLMPRRKLEELMALGFDLHGDPVTAAKFGAMSTSHGDARSDPARTVRMRDGRIEGRLLLDGRPAANLPVRLRGYRHDMDTMNGPRGEEHLSSLTRDELLDESRLQLTFRDLVTESLARTLTATRTDSDGRFRFDGLPDDQYLLILLLDMDPATTRRVSSRAGVGLIEISPDHPRRDLGDIRLGVKP